MQNSWHYDSPYCLYISPAVKNSNSTTLLKPGQCLSVSVITWKLNEFRAELFTVCNSQAGEALDPFDVLWNCVQELHLSGNSNS